MNQGEVIFGKSSNFMNSETKKIFEFNEKKLINAVDKYFKKNYIELYNKNNLGNIFNKAREDKEIERKMFNAINKFIFNFYE